MLIIKLLTVYCLNGANAPCYRGCLSATFHGIEAIRMIGNVVLMPISRDKYSGHSISSRNESIFLLSYNVTK